LTTQLIKRLEREPVLPLIEVDDADTGLAVAGALHAGGLRVVEVVQRSAAALDCLALIAEQMPDLLVGAGTVLSGDQAIECIDAGAEFIVSPGVDDGVVDATRSRGFDVIPGAMTPTELQRAFNLGLGVAKFFPASAAGGVPALKALGAVFRQLRFVPTGGVSVANLADYLALDCVLACGGSWLAPADAVRAGDLARITALAAEALAIATEVRGKR
jgi:2-dehydro-3-deoxyphosphogluconate aldolase/(4S)-4-hydroxy-2-oxoglutarate aldolase